MPLTNLNLKKQRPIGTVPKEMFDAIDKVHVALDTNSYMYLTAKEAEVFNRVTLFLNAETDDFGEVSFDNPKIVSDLHDECLRMFDNFNFRFGMKKKGRLHYEAHQAESGNTFVLMKDHLHPKGLNVFRIGLEAEGLSLELNQLLRVKLLKVAEEMADEFNRIIA